MKSSYLNQERKTQDGVIIDWIARLESLDRFRRENEKKRSEDKSKNLNLCLSNANWNKLFGVKME